MKRRAGLRVLENVVSLIERGRAFYARVILGMFECPRCRHPGPHQMIDLGSAYVCGGCEVCVDSDDVLPQLRGAS